MQQFLRLTVLFTAGLVAAWLPAEELTIEVTSGSNLRLPCRIHLRDAKGKSIRSGQLPFWRDHFVCPGLAKVTVSPGLYTYEIERGPEYRPAKGELRMADGRDRKLSVRLQRIAHLARRGWWSGELHVHRRLKEVPLHMRAEDLHVAPVITWWNGRNEWKNRPSPKNTLAEPESNRFYDVMAGEDEREGGALLFFGLKHPLPLPGGKRAFPEFPSPMKFVALARKQKGVWIDIEKPFWWDTPVWLASGQIDSIGLANNHMCRSQMYESEAWGNPRDAKRLPAPRGNGFWTQEIYYHILNSGLRVPPSAGSASGVLPNPVGYNRVYVHTGSKAKLTYLDWWKGLKSGRSFVTNGPLLICRANKQLPGHIFSARQSIDITLDVEVTANDKVPVIEIIRNGRAIHQKLIPAGSKSTAKTTLSFRKSGWFLVRAVADNSKTFRFASTAPFYVEIGATKHRVSRRSIQFFLDWLTIRAKRVRSKLQDPAKLAQVLRHHDLARQFWRKKMEQANAQ